MARLSTRIVHQHQLWCGFADTQGHYGYHKHEAHLASGWLGAEGQSHPGSSDPPSWVGELPSAREH